MMTLRSPSLRIVSIVLFVFTTWVSVRASAQTVPEPSPDALGVWDDGAEERRVELARLEARVAELGRAERSHEALDLLSYAAREGLARDRDSLRRLTRAAESLHIPGSDPGWIYAGLPLLIFGAAGTLATGLVQAVYTSCLHSPSSCDSPDLSPYVPFYVTAGVFFVVGAVLCFVGVDLHIFDPERRAFLERRRGIVRVLVDAQHGIGLTW